MRKTIWISIIVAVVVFAGIGIYLLLYMKGMTERVTPEIRDVSLDLGSVTAETTEITSTVMIYNPNSISVPIDKMSFDIRVDGIAIGYAETVDLHLEKESEVPVEIIAKIDNSEIPIVMASHIRNGEKSAASIDIDITFDLGFGHITLPISMKRNVETDLLAYLANIEPMTIEQTADIPLLGKKVCLHSR